MTVYKVAYNYFTIETENNIMDTLLPNYSVFKCNEEKPAKMNLNLTCVPFESLNDYPINELIDETQNENELGNWKLYRTPHGYCIDLCYQKGFPTHRMITNHDFSECKAAILLEEPFGKDVLNSFILMAYSINCLHHDTAIIHASSVMIGENSYAFLGISGTGKSTHSQLWLKYIPNTDLLNDDHPAVRIMPDGKVHIFGTPWSGKTPCYKNLEKVLNGFVVLKQAPENKIRKLKGFEAFITLKASTSSLKQDLTLQQKLGNIIEKITNQIPGYFLENLPNKDAALLCYNTLGD